MSVNYFQINIVHKELHMMVYPSSQRAVSVEAAGVVEVVDARKEGCLS